MVRIALDEASGAGAKGGLEAMSSEWTEGVCNESTGFLFRHRCDRYPQNRCEACNKPICPDHERPLDTLMLCVACNRAETRRRGLKNSPRRGYDDNPYFYGGTYYPGYGHYYGSSRIRRTLHSHGGPGGHVDPNDLNAGDAESLKNEDDGDFETDMGES